MSGAEGSERPSLMKGKPLKIDWDELESAFENDREDVAYFLDLVTGQVVLDGEGEEGDFDNGEDLEEVPPTAAPRNDAVRLYVEPPTVEEELAWMDAFLDEAGELDDALQDKLLDTLDAGSPDGFREALRADAEVRDRWFLYRTERLHEKIDGWLERHQVKSTEPAPWK